MSALQSLSVEQHAPAFVQWINYVLRERGLRIEELRELREVIAALVETLFDVDLKLASSNKRAERSVEHCINFMAKHRPLDAPRLVSALLEGKEHELLYFVWELALHYVIKPWVGSLGQSPSLWESAVANAWSSYLASHSTEVALPDDKEALLTCSRAYCSFLVLQGEKSIDADVVNVAEESENFGLAFHLMESKYGLPPLLNADNAASQPDTRMLLLLVVLLFKRFPAAQDASGASTLSRTPRKPLPQLPQETKSGGKVGATYTDSVGAEEVEEVDVASLLPPGVELKAGCTYAIAMVDYKAADVSQLSLKRGTLLEVTEKFPTGWWKGQLPGQNKSGIFNSSNVEIIHKGRNRRSVISVPKDWNQSRPQRSTTLSRFHAGAHRNAPARSHSAIPQAGVAKGSEQGAVPPSKSLPTIPRVKGRSGTAPRSPPPHARKALKPPQETAPQPPRAGSPPVKQQTSPSPQRIEAKVPVWRQRHPARDAVAVSALWSQAELKRIYKFEDHMFNDLLAQASALENNIRCSLLVNDLKGLTKSVQQARLKILKMIDLCFHTTQRKTTLCAFLSTLDALMYAVSGMDIPEGEEWEKRMAALVRRLLLLMSRVRERVSLTLAKQQEYMRSEELRILKQRNAEHEKERLAELEAQRKQAEAERLRQEEEQRLRRLQEEEEERARLRELEEKREEERMDAMTAIARQQLERSERQAQELLRAQIRQERDALLPRLCKLLRQNDAQHRRSMSGVRDFPTALSAATALLDHLSSPHFIRWNKFGVRMAGEVPSCLHSVVSSPDSAHYFIEPDEYGASQAAECVQFAASAVERFREWALQPSLRAQLASSESSWAAEDVQFCGELSCLRYMLCSIYQSPKPGDPLFSKQTTHIVDRFRFVSIPAELVSLASGVEELMGQVQLQGKVSQPYLQRQLMDDAMAVVGTFLHYVSLVSAIDITDREEVLEEAKAEFDIAYIRLRNALEEARSHFLAADTIEPSMCHLARAVFRLQGLAKTLPPTSRSTLTDAAKVNAFVKALAASSRKLLQSLQVQNISEMRAPDCIRAMCEIISRVEDGLLVLTNEAARSLIHSKMLQLSLSVMCFLRALQDVMVNDAPCARTFDSILVFVKAALTTALTDVSKAVRQELQESEQRQQTLQREESRAHFLQSNPQAMSAVSKLRQMLKELEVPFEFALSRYVRDKITLSDEEPSKLIGALKEKAKRVALSLKSAKLDVASFYAAIEDLLIFSRNLAISFQRDATRDRNQAVLSATAAVARDAEALVLNSVSGGAPSAEHVSAQVRSIKNLVDIAVLAVAKEFRQKAGANM